MTTTELKPIAAEQSDDNDIIEMAKAVAAQLSGAQRIGTDVYVIDQFGNEFKLTITRNS